MSQLINYTLPEFGFIDSISHQGNLLEGRTVVQHIRSYTIVEVIAMDEVSLADFTTPTYAFMYNNPWGVTERHLLVLHFSLAWEAPMPVNDTLLEIFEKIATWYSNYLQWEDHNITTDEEGKHN
jgi:hypothetical protein